MNIMKCRYHYVLLYIFLFCGTYLATSKFSNFNNPKPSESAHRYLFRPLRRSIKNFVVGGTATISIVFQRSVHRLQAPPKVRWFKKSPTKMPHAEIPDMLNIDGDSRYRVRSVSSYDITAVTLTILAVENIGYPMVFVTCFSVDQIPFQYQLDTQIDHPIYSSRTNYLDGIIWRNNPPSTITFSTQGQLSVNCAVTMESVSTRKLDKHKLHIYRSYLDRREAHQSASSNNQLMSIGCGMMYYDKENFSESSGKYTYSGDKGFVNVTKRNETKRTVLYDLSFEVINGTQDDAGVYTCAGERPQDRTYISSWVRLTQIDRPALILAPCDESMIQREASSSTSSKSSNSVRFRLHPNHVACVRCRAYDNLTTQIMLRKDGENITSSTPTMRLDRHLNVMDGGLSELTITFLQPNLADVGKYECSVSNLSGSDKVGFFVSLK